MTSWPAVNAQTSRRLHIASPGPRREKLPLWVAVGMLVLLFSSTFFAYLTLVAPAPARVEKPADPRREVVKARAVEPQSDEIRAMMVLARERFRPPVEVPAALPEPAARVQSRVRSPAGPAANPAVAPARAMSEATAALDAPAKSREKSPEPDASLAVAVLQASPAIVPLQKEIPAALEPVDGDESMRVRAVRGESPAARPVQHEGLRVTDNSLSRLRGELETCGKPGLWRSDLCRESVRWKYCHPNGWNTTPECSVQRFASSPSQN